MLRKKGISISEISDWLLVLMTILLSGCVFFTMKYRIITTALFFVVAIFNLWLRHKKITKGSLLVLLAAFIILFVSYIANAQILFISNAADYIITFIQITAVCIMVNVLNQGDFQNKYVSIMRVICAISLVCFVVQTQFTELVSLISSKDLVSNFTISWFHTWGWNYIFSRNAGPFWEPGAFQGFIFIAVLFVFKREDLRKNYMTLLLFLITIITTMSTTGYILLAIAAMYFMFLSLKGSTKKTRDNLAFIIRCVVLLAGLILLFQFILKSQAISEKFINSNQSYNIRISDIQNGLNVVFQRPLFGFGIMSNDLISAWKEFGSASNSVGVFAILQYFGVFFGLVILSAYVISLRKAYRPLNPVVVLLMFLVITMTECTLTFPVYVIFIFYNLNSKKKDNVLGKKQ